LKKFVFLLTLIAAGSHLHAAILYTATLFCATPACISGSVTTQVSWEVEAQVFSVEVDDNLGNFLFGLTGPLVPTNQGSIFPTQQTISGLDLTVINLLTSTVGLSNQNGLGATTAPAPSFANVVLITSDSSITGFTRFTATLPVGTLGVPSPEPVTWGFIAAGLGAMLMARARKQSRGVSNLD
jgi:hypothetical protein